MEDTDCDVMKDNCLLIIIMTSALRFDFVSFCRSALQYKSPLTANQLADLFVNQYSKAQLDQWNGKYKRTRLFNQALDQLLKDGQVEREARPPLEPLWSWKIATMPLSTASSSTLTSATLKTTSYLDSFQSSSSTSSSSSSSSKEVAQPCDELIEEIHAFCIASLQKKSPQTKAELIHAWRQMYAEDEWKGVPIVYPFQKVLQSLQKQNRVTCQIEKDKIYWSWATIQKEEEKLSTTEKELRQAWVNWVFAVFPQQNSQIWEDRIVHMSERLFDLWIQWMKKKE